MVVNDAGHPYNDDGDNSDHDSSDYVISDYNGSHSHEEISDEVDDILNDDEHDKFNYPELANDKWEDDHGNLEER